MAYIVPQILVLEPVLQKYWHILYRQKRLHTIYGTQKS